MGEVGGSLCRGQPTKPPTGHHRLVALMTLAKEVDLVNVGNSALVKRYGVVDFAMQVGDRTKVGFKPSHLYCTLGWVGFVGFLQEKEERPIYGLSNSTTNCKKWVWKME